LATEFGNAGLAGGAWQKTPDAALVEPLCMLISPVS
jgi:hypothetical protein